MRIVIKIITFIQKAWKNFFVRLIIMLAGLVGALALAGAFKSKESFLKKFVEIVTSGDVVGALFLGIGTILVAHIAIFIARKLEDTFKIESDPKKIIVKYSGHKKIRPSDENFYTKDGALMYLTCPPKRKRRCFIHHGKKHTEERELYDDLIDAYLALTDEEKNNPPKESKFVHILKGIWGKMRAILHNIKEAIRKFVNIFLSNKWEEKKKKDLSGLQYALYLSELNIFANVEGKVNVRFEDKNFVAQPPDFVRDNALELMEAHRNSNYANNPTIRLKDIAYEKDKVSHELTLYTERTQYFDMLITNRCMDFKLKSLVTLRDVYESGNTISPLADSQLSNQIGINGLIITSDGYLLLEKRGFRKVIWKGKLAQPISLAMKLSSVKKERLTNGVLFPKHTGNGQTGEITKEDEYEYSSNVFKDIILDTISSNFGLTENDIKDFDTSKGTDTSQDTKTSEGTKTFNCFNISENLLGIARDLLEGGKPNMYFYVILKYNAEECKKILEERARNSAKMTVKERKEHKDVPKLTYGKLDSDYYFINIKDIGIDFKYRLKVKAKKVIKVYRKFRPMVNIFSVKADGLAYRMKKRLGLSLQDECGEALLACLYYVGACKDRLYPALNLPLPNGDKQSVRSAQNADSATSAVSEQSQNASANASNM